MTGRYWEKLNPDVPCPYHFTADELRDHATDGEGFNEAQDFWDRLEHFVSRDGWTANDTYDDAVGFFEEIRDMGLKKRTGKEREEFRRQFEWLEGLKKHQGDAKEHMQAVTQ